MFPILSKTSWSSHRPCNHPLAFVTDLLPPYKTRVLTSWTIFQASKHQTPNTRLHCSHIQNMAYRLHVNSMRPTPIDRSNTLRTRKPSSQVAAYSWMTEQTSNEGPERSVPLTKLAPQVFTRSFSPRGYLPHIVRYSETPLFTEEARTSEDLDELNSDSTSIHSSDSDLRYVERSPMSPLYENGIVARVRRLLDSSQDYAMHTARGRAATCAVLFSLGAAVGWAAAVFVRNARHK